LKTFGVLHNHGVFLFPFWYILWPFSIGILCPFGIGILCPFGIFYVHLLYFMAIWYFCGHSCTFSQFGMLHQEKLWQPCSGLRDVHVLTLVSIHTYAHMSNTTTVTIFRWETEQPQLAWKCSYMCHVHTYASELLAGWPD
jgi:hypothetical protein